MLQSLSDNSSTMKLAIILDGVSEQWQMNVLQISGCCSSIKVSLEGYGIIEAPAIRLTQFQARHLATQITELLGPETVGDSPRMPATAKQ